MEGSGLGRRAWIIEYWVPLGLATASLSLLCAFHAGEGAYWGGPWPYGSCWALTGLPGSL